MKKRNELGNSIIIRLRGGQCKKQGDACGYHETLIRVINVVPISVFVFGLTTRSKITCKILPKFRSGGTKIEVWRSKSFQNSGLEAPKSRSGGLESSPGEGLGASWAASVSKTPPRCLLKASWAALRPCWGSLGDEHASNKVSKMRPKSNKHWYKNRSNF